MSDQRIRTIISGRSDDYRRALAASVQSTRSFAQEQRKAAVSSRMLQHETRVLNRALADQSRRLGVLTLQWQQFRFAIMTLALRTAVSGMAALAASVTALGGGIVQLTQQAGLLSAAFGTLGVSSLAAFAQGAIAVTLGLNGVGKALTTTGKAHENALKKLTPAARSFVGEMAGVRDAFREIQLVAQEGLFPGLTRAVANLKPLLEPVKDSIYNTAQAIGYLGERMSEVLAGRKGDIASLMHRNVISVRRFGDAGINVFRGLVDVMRAADPFIGHVTRQMVTFTEKIADLAKGARMDGTLGRFFKDVQESWDQWLRIIGNVGGTVFNVLKAASGPAKVLTKAIETTTQKWQEWTGNQRGQNQMTRFFTNSNRVLGSMAEFSGAIFESFFRLSDAGTGNAVGFFDMLRKRVLPTIEDLGLMLNEGMFPHLVEFIGTFADMAREALPALQPFANILGAVAEAITNLLKAMTPLMGTTPLAPFMVGAALLFGWGKLKLAISLVVLELSRALGLINEINVRRPGMSMLTTRGGRNNAAGPAGGGAYAPGFIGRAQRTVDRHTPTSVPTAAEGAAQRAGRNSTMYPLGKINPRISPYPQGRAGYRLDPGRVGQVTTPAGPNSVFVNPRGSFARDYPGGQPGSRGAAYARDRTVTHHPTRSQLTGQVAGLADSTARGIGRGVKSAAAAIPKLIGPMFGMAALNGLISALGGSGAKRTLQNVAADFMSGISFGAIPNAAEENATKGTSLGRRISTGKFTIGSGDTAGASDRTARLLNKTAAGRDLNKPLNLYKDADRQAMKSMVADLEHAGKVSHDTRNALLKMVDAFGAKSWKRSQAEQDSALKQAQGSWKAFTNDQGRNLHELRLTTGRTMRNITGTFGKESDRGRQLLSANYKLAADAVRKLMKDGKVSTRTGLKEINALMAKALMALGWTADQARDLRDNGNLAGSSRADRPTQASLQGPNSARGSLTSLAGAPGRDKIPLSIMAAPGEDVAIFNRHQRKVADQRFADVGGLRGLFSNVTTAHNKPMSYERGGIPQSGSSIVGLGRWLQGQGYNVSEHPAFGGVQGEHSRAGWHYKSGALDVNADGREGGEPKWLDRLSNMLRGAGWSHLWRVADHFDHLHVDVGSSGGAGAAAAMMAPPKIARVKTKMDGAVGDLVQAQLDRARKAAQERVNSVAASVGGTEGGGNGGGAGIGKDALKQLWISMGGPASAANLAAAVAMAESSGIASAKNVNTDGSVDRGLWQINDVHGARSTFDAQANTRAAIAISKQGTDWSPWSAWKAGRHIPFLQRGGLFAGAGLMASASANMPGSGGSAPNVNPDDAVQHTPGKAKKGKKPKAPWAAAQSPITLARLRKAQKRGGRKIPAWVRQLQRATNKQTAEGWLTSILPSMAGVDATSRSQSAIYGARNSAYDLARQDYIDTDEVTGVETINQGAITSRSNQIRDLVRMLTGKFPEEGDLLPVLGEDMLTSFGIPKFRPAGGIAANTREQLALTAIGIDRMKSAKSMVLEQMERLADLWRSSRVVHDRMKGRQAAMVKNAPTWQEAVAFNESSISDMIEQNADIQKRGIDHRTPKESKETLAYNRKRIRDLRKDNKNLRKDKPRTTGMRKERKAQFDAIGADRSYYARILDTVGGGREMLQGGVYGDWSQRNTSINAMAPTWKDSYAGLWEAYQGHGIDAGSLVKELNDVIGTKLQTPKTDNGQRRAELAEELLSQAQLRESASGAMSSVLRGFAPMMGQRLVGAFAHGGVVPETGMALVHRDEVITPDPQGPFGSSAGGNVNLKAGDTTLVLTGDMSKLFQMVDARIRTVAPGIVGEQLGREARRMRVSPGR